MFDFFQLLKWVALLIVLLAVVAGLATFVAHFTAASDDAMTYYTGTRSNNLGQPLHESAFEMFGTFFVDAVMGDRLASFAALLGSVLLTMFGLSLLLWLVKVVLS